MNPHTPFVPRWRVFLERRLSLVSLLYLLPFVTVVLVREAPNSLQLAIAAISAVGIVALAYRGPVGAFLALVVGLPFQGLVLSIAYKYGVPDAIVRGAGAWKEALALGILARGIHCASRERHELDGLDKLVLAYVGVVALYGLLPGLLVHSSGPLDPGAPRAVDIRLLGFRADAGFALVFFGLRHAVQGDLGAVRVAFQRCVLAVGAVIAAVGLYQFLDHESWRHFVIVTAGVPAYQIQVLDVPPDLAYTNVLWLVPNPRLRVGSVFISAFDLGDYLLLAIGIGLQMAIGQRLRGWNITATVILLGCLLANQTRADLLGAVLLFLVLLRPQRAAENPGRARMAFVAALLVIVAAPFFSETRLSSESEADRLSTQGHLDEWEAGWRQIQAKPLGTGLGTAPGVGDRYTNQAVISDNSYLQVGAELGVFTMALFVILLVALFRRLAKETSDLARAMFAIGCGLALAGMFHHVWITYALPWAFWGGAALCLPARRRLESDELVDRIPDQLPAS